MWEKKARVSVSTSKLRSALYEGSGQKFASGFTNLAIHELTQVWQTVLIYYPICVEPIIFIKRDSLLV